MSLQIKAAMPGNPSFYENGLQDYSTEGLQKLKEAGVNTIFLNLAWSRPHIDAVTLEHVAVSKSYPLTSDEMFVKANREKLRQRATNAKALGLKTMLLTGIPQYFDYSKLPESYQVLMGAKNSTIDSTASVTCVESEETVKMYQELLSDLLIHVPDIDGILIYTYDELAEICDEDSDCPRCKGIPQEKRIAKFLNAFYDYAKQLKPDFSLWWEPWELSWSQVYGTLEMLNHEIAVVCHSNLHEVYFVNHPDLWFRSIAALCQEQNRNMVGELFMGGTGEDLGFTAMYPCPRLVFEQIRFTSALPGVTGIKEYYGICPQYMSINEKVMSACLKGEENYDAIIRQLAGEYTQQQELLSKFWSLTSRALELLPWEISWVMRFYNYPPYDPSYWGKVSFGNMMKTPWNTPSWFSNRRSYYMISDDTRNLTDAYCKDILKRFCKCVQLMEEAVAAAKQIAVEPGKKWEFSLQVESVLLLKALIQCRRNHLRLSLAMQKLREAGQNMEEIQEILKEELNNAENLKALLGHSAVPYMLDQKKIQEGIQSILIFMDDTRLGKDYVIQQHKEL